MRVYRRRKWDVTHSLTPQPDFSLDTNYKINMPEIPELKKATPYIKDTSSTMCNRSKKHRIVQQRNTEIERTNRMLYQKIRKIMQKGHSSEKKIEPQAETDLQNNSQFLSTSKPLSLPQVPNLHTTQSQLTTILDNRPKFAQKYFEELAQAHSKMINVHTQQLANFVCFGWKVKVLKLNHGQYIVLSGKKGKRQVKKKYIYQRVKSKVEGAGLEEWVKAKFEFQI